MVQLLVDSGADLWIENEVRITSLKFYTYIRHLNSAYYNISLTSLVFACTDHGTI